MPPKMSKVTRSSTSKKQRQAIDSLATVTSPPKAHKTKKSPKKQASFESPEVKGITPQVVTVTKQAKSSEDEKSSSNDNSTKDDGALLVTQVTMTSVSDPKFEHLLTYYFMAIGDQHDIRQAFIQNQIVNFETFINSCTLQYLRDMQMTKGNSSGDALNKAKLKLVNEVLLYYQFLYADQEYAKADDPIQWIKQDFKIWKIQGYHVSTAAYNASQAANSGTATATVTTTAAAATVKQKEQDDSFLSWKRSRKDEKEYPVLDSDQMFSEWSVKFEHKIHSEEIFRMIDPGFHTSSLDAGSDTDLFHKQKNHFASVLDGVLQTSEGKRLIRKHPDDPCKVWSLHQAHSQSSATLSSICTGLSQELAKMKIVDYNTPTNGLDTFDSYLSQYNKISPTNSKMPNNMVVMLLEAATCGNLNLLSAWTQRGCMKKELNPPTPTYDEYYKYLL